MLKSHDRGWPRFTLVVTLGSSQQSHRIYVRCQGRIDSHDARGPEWEGMQLRPLKRTDRDQSGVKLKAPYGGL